MWVFYNQQWLINIIQGSLYDTIKIASNILATTLISPKPASHLIIPDNAWWKNPYQKKMRSAYDEVGEQNGLNLLDPSKLGP